MKLNSTEAAVGDLTFPAIIELVLFGQCKEQRIPLKKPGLAIRAIGIPVHFVGPLLFGNP